MTNTNFLELITKLSRRMKHMKVDLTIYDAEEKITYNIAKGAQNPLDKYYVVFDEHGNINIMDIPDSYYTRNIDELKELLLFILRHKKLYTTKLKNDCMEIYTESLEELLDNEIDDASTYDQYDL